MGYLNEALKNCLQFYQDQQGPSSEEVKIEELEDPRVSRQLLKHAMVLLYECGQMLGCVLQAVARMACAVGAGWAKVSACY